VTVKELKEFIVHKHRGVKNISILKINTEKELNDCILLSRGSNVIVKRVTFESVEFVQQSGQTEEKPISNRNPENARQKREYLSRRIVVNRKRKHVQKTPVVQKPRGIPNRFLVNYSAEISKDAEHLKEHCPNIKLTVRGDAQLKIS
jgi:hypothetical protein